METCYAPFLQDAISLRCPQNVFVKFQLKNPPQIIYYIMLKILIWSGSRNMLFSVHVSLNANELLFPTTFFQNRAVPL